VGVLVGVLTWALLTAAGVAVPAAPAQAAALSSAQTVRAADYDDQVADAPFPDLAVTVSQTEDLIAQGITVSWTGGEQSTRPDNGIGGANFLQIAQCWGEDPEWPGHPDRTTCQYGAFLAKGGTRDSSRSSTSDVADEDQEVTSPASGPFNPPYTSIPFRSVTGEVIASVVNGVKKPVDVNTNPYFTKFTTNEIPWAGSGSDGTGTVKFEVQTSAQAAGLGCGDPLTAADGTVTGRPCWLVIIPRGEADEGEQAITNPGLFWDAWEHHLAVKLDFRPLGTRCAIGAAERQIAGSELANYAVSSWQPVLCNQAGGSIYTQLAIAESDALLAANGASGTAPLALSSRPLAAGNTDSLTYAPVAVAGVTIAFAIDRLPSPLGGVPAEELAKAHVPFTDLRLTPRLLAKLLTGSYRDALPSGADRSHIGYDGAADPGHNAINLTRDPDFLAINDPEWQYQSLLGAGIADALIPQGRSDAAWAVWSYILADAEARAFLEGDPDPWGMIVNPWWSIDATINPSGEALTLPREDFPKADPIEAPLSGGNPAVNLVTLRPFTNDLAQGAFLTLRGDSLSLGDINLSTTPATYRRAERALVGDQAVLGVTDTPAAARYLVIGAALRNPAGQFVTPTTSSLTAAAQAMTADARQPQVLRFDAGSTQAKAAPDAYPLAMPIYAAARADIADKELRGDYADFIRYAVGAGQVPGLGNGELPPGYAPIPADWTAQALAAATKIAAGPQPAATTTGSTTSTSGSSGFTGDLSTLDVPAADEQPAATGDAAGALSGPRTPADPVEVAATSAVPLSLVVTLAAAAATWLFGRRRRLRT